MKRFTLLCFWLFGCVAIGLWAGVARTPAQPGQQPAEAPAIKTHQVKLNGQVFTLPVGFTIELAAAPPLTLRPITIDFDEKGRMYVAESSGSNEKVQVQLEKKPHKILRLEDTNGDGVFDKSTAFVEKVMFPEGTMWHDGSLYVAAPPNILKFTDTDGDGKADKEEVWFDGKTLTGCANDLHGPYFGPDGYIYWCKGAFAEQTYPRKNGPPLVTRAAHIFRAPAKANVDPSEVEAVMTSGMDNPVDMAFLPNGEKLFCGTFLQYPAGGKRDGIQHAVIGGVFGKEFTDVLQNHPWTGPKVMPVLSHLGPAAPCGFTRYESTVFGPDYQDNVFTCLFNLQKVTRHVITTAGATFHSEDSDFLVSSSKDFHPTDVMEDADGSLLVVDTGGWYKLCCPTSQLVKPDIHGAIYRVRKVGAPKVDDPRGEKLFAGNPTEQKFVELLGDPRPAVRHQAMKRLAASPKSSTRLLPATRNPSVEVRRNAQWTWSRCLESPSVKNNMNKGLARALDGILRGGLNDRDDSVRHVAAQTVSLHRLKNFAPMMKTLLKGTSLSLRRIAAEALGRIGDKSAVPDLLDACRGSGDRFLDHSLIYALIEINDPESTAQGLKHENPNVRRSALIALDQMPAKASRAEAVVAELTSSDRDLRESAWWIAGKHPEWGGQLSKVLANRLADPKLTPAEADELATQLGNLAKSPAVQQLLAHGLKDSPTPLGRKVVLEAMRRSGLREAPASWANALLSDADHAKGEQLQATLDVLRSLRWPANGLNSGVKTLQALAEDASQPARTRLLAHAVLPAKTAATLADPFFEFAAQSVNVKQPPVVRSLAADVFAKSSLTKDQLVALAAGLGFVHPLELDRVLEPFAKSNDEAVGRALLAALQEPAVRAAVRVDMVKTRLAKQRPAIQKQAESLYALINADFAKQREKLEKLATSLPTGDVHRGHLVFNNPKVNCVACHTIGYLGGKTGPDLTRIGSIRTERDLLESILFPSASLVRSYEPVLVTTRSGKTHNGLIRQETTEFIVLATGPNEEVRVNRSDVEDIQPSAISIMPAGLDQQLSPQEMADLVAFLRACK